MSPQDQAFLRSLKIINDNPQISQRELAEWIGVSVGKANYLLKPLVEKGKIKINNFGYSDFCVSDILKLYKWRYSSFSARPSEACAKTGPNANPLCGNV